ncbi:MAG TPA: TIGR02281 family clan AA aspartic protease [Caulobacteraceae bacterium]
MSKSVFIIGAAVASSIFAAQALGVGRSHAEQPGQAVSIAKAPDGHFWATVRTPEGSARLLIDTGATAVVLTRTDAARLGVSARPDAPRRPIATASGVLEGAVVRLESLSVGGAGLHDVEALIVPDGAQASLLGMSYLGRLSRIEATPTSLILRR